MLCDVTCLATRKKNANPYMEARPTILQKKLPVIGTSFIELDRKSIYERQDQRDYKRNCL